MHLCRPKSGNGPKLVTRLQFPVLSKSKTGNGRSFHLGLDPKLEMQMPDPKVETSLTVIHDLISQSINTKCLLRRPCVRLFDFRALRFIV